MSTTPTVVTYELLEFNPTRYMRDKEAAKLSVIEDGVNQGYLWMSVKDIRKNMRKFGSHPALEKALRAYGESV